MNVPHRRIELELKIGADSLEALLLALREFRHDLSNYHLTGDEPYTLPFLSTGHESSRTAQLRYDPSIDHDIYTAQVNAYYEANKQASEDATP